LPLDKLRRQDPILFFDEVDLYEDELGDNGMSLLNIRVRVMPARLLLLSRFFLRLDDVIFRVRDTRIYVEFETGQVMRDYCAMEGHYATLKEVLVSLRCTDV
jgi:type 2A phosphatase activator TIP41